MLCPRGTLPPFQLNLTVKPGMDSPTSTSWQCAGSASSRADPRGRSSMEASSTSTASHVRGSSCRQLVHQTKAKCCTLGLGSAPCAIRLHELNPWHHSCMVQSCHSCDGYTCRCLLQAWYLLPHMRPAQLPLADNRSAHRCVVEAITAAGAGVIVFLVVGPLGLPAQHAVDCLRGMLRSLLQALGGAACSRLQTAIRYEWWGGTGEF